MTPEEAYDIWKADPTPENLNQTVLALDKPIGYKVASMGGAPHLKHQARLFAAKAIPKYDPSAGTKLSTFVQGHLQSLNRYGRESGGPVKVPERAQLDAWHLEKVSREFIDRHGQEPDIHELADLSKLPVKRIREVRRATRPVVADSQILGSVDQSAPDLMSEALEYIYGDSDRIDRLIIEKTTGYGGGEPMQKKDVAAQLGISAAQVTRRSERIARKLQELETDLESIS